MKNLLSLACVALFTIGLTAATSIVGSVRAKPAVPARIAHGQKVNLQDYVVKGKTTIFDFTSEYCGPCRGIAPHLHKLHAQRADIVVVEVDINRPDVKGIDWNSPVAQQYALESIPHFKVFGPDGKLQVEGNKARALVTSWFE